jgi:hypothetical protein
MLALTATTAQARTRFEVYQSCTASQNNPYYFQEIAYCQGFVDGVFAAGDGFCGTGTVQTGALRMVVVNYARTHPQDLSMAAGIVVQRAFAAAWPCKP